MKCIDIIKKYPNLYDEDFYFEVEAGWLPLLDELSEKLTSIQKETGEYFKAGQVKSKFGGLRYYLSNINHKNAAIYTLIQEYEIKSNYTCEICSKAGIKYLRNNWVATLCEEDAKALNYEKLNSIYFS